MIDNNIHLKVKIYFPTYSEGPDNYSIHLSVYILSSVLGNLLSSRVDSPSAANRWGELIAFIKYLLNTLTLYFRLQQLLF